MNGVDSDKTLCLMNTLIMVGAFSGRENTLNVVDVDPRFIAEIDPLLVGSKIGVP